MSQALSELHKASHAEIDITHRKPSTNALAAAISTALLSPAGIEAGKAMAANFARCASTSARTIEDTGNSLMRRSKASLKAWLMTIPNKAIASRAAARETALLIPDAAPA